MPSVLSFSVGLMKSSLRSDEIQGVALDEINSVRTSPCEAGFHRESDLFTRPDGFDRVFSVKENTPILAFCFYFWDSAFITACASS